MKALFFSEPGIGSRKKTAVELARHVISEAGGLHGLYGVSVHDSIYKRVDIEFRALLNESSSSTSMRLGRPGVPTNCSRSCSPTWRPSRYHNELYGPSHTGQHEIPGATSPLLRRRVARKETYLATALGGVPPLWPSTASERDTRLPDLAVGEVKVGLPRAAVRRLLPAAYDRVAVIADRRGEALRKRCALAPELPPPVSDAHLVDAADAALVGVELEVGPVRGVAAHDRDAVGCLGHLHRRAPHQVCSRVMPFDRGPSLARPRQPVWWLGLEGPFADERLEPLQRLLCGWLVHRVAPPSDCSGNLIPTRYPHVIRLVWHHSSLRPFTSVVAKRRTVQPRACGLPRTPCPRTSENFPSETVQKVTQWWLESTFSLAHRGKIGPFCPFRRPVSP